MVAESQGKVIPQGTIGCKRGVHGQTHLGNAGTLLHACLACRKPLRVIIPKEVSGRDQGIW